MISSYSVAWLVSADSIAIDKYKVLISALNCYGAVHQLPIFVEPVLVQQTSRHYCQDRILNVLKYLPYFDWLFVSDADIIIANYSRSIFSYIDDAFDVILHERDNGIEVAAGTFFVRNSHGGRRFLDRWYSLSDQGNIMMNADNGDLQELLYQYTVRNFRERPCATGRNKTLFKSMGDAWKSYKIVFLNCTMQPIFNTRASQEYEKNSYSIIFEEKIKVFKEFRGFYRSLEGDPLLKNNCRKHDLICNFLEGDFILHGKALQHYLTNNFITCNFSSLTMNWTSELQGILLPPKEKWYKTTNCKREEVVRTSRSNISFCEA